MPSRRLGLSLGVDLVPPKTCTLDCLYCEVGKTTRKTLTRSSFFPIDTLKNELERTLIDLKGRLDYITLAGSGEPTLNLDIGRAIGMIKELSSKPVAVLTNGTLLDRPDVRRDLVQADLVIPSLDTVREGTFARLNRPAPGLNLKKIIQGLVDFRSEYHGALWIEVLLVQGINDSQEELADLKECLTRIRPDRIQVNTVFRPPAYGGANPVNQEALAEAARYLGSWAEPVGAFSKPQARTLPDTEEHEKILTLVARRPCTAEDVAEVLGRPVEAVRPLLDTLLDSGRLRIEPHDHLVFYALFGSGDS